MPFTTEQAAAMSVSEVECRVCRRSNAGGYGSSGWESGQGDASEWSNWLAGLLFPAEYPPGYPAHVCSVASEADAAGSRLGAPGRGPQQTADSYSRYLLTWAEAN